MSLIGTVVAGAIGTAVAQYFQNRTWRKKQDYANERLRLENTIQFQGALSDSLDSYLYDLQVLVNAIRYKGVMKTDDFINAKWEKLGNTRDGWYSKFHHNLALMDWFFDQEALECFKEISIGDKHGKTLEDVFEQPNEKPNQNCLNGLDQEVILLYVAQVMNDQEALKSFTKPKKPTARVVEDAIDELQNKMGAMGVKIEEFNKFLLSQIHR